MNHDLETLIETLVNERVEQRLKEEKKQFLDAYEQLMALRKHTFDIIYLLEPLLYRQEFVNKVYQLETALKNIRLFTPQFEEIYKVSDEGMKNLFETRKNLRKVCEEIASSIEDDSET